MRGGAAGPMGALGCAGLVGAQGRGCVGAAPATRTRPAHRTTAVRRPQTNGFIERFHRTLLDEHLRVAGRTKWYEGLEEMQIDLDAYHVHYNTERPHQGRGMKGRTPYAVFKAGLHRKPKPRREVQPAA